jgi:hypothetical protein
MWVTGELYVSQNTCMQRYISDLSPKGNILKQASPLMMDGYKLIDREKEAGKSCFHLSVGIPNLNQFLGTTSQYPARPTGRL